MRFLKCAKNDFNVFYSVRKLSLRTNLALVMVIPLEESGWKTLNYDHIVANKVTHQNHEMQIKVDHSAGLSIFKFDKSLMVSSFSFQLHIEGKTPEQSKIGFEEDAYFRFGLVVEGSKTLGFFSSMVSPEWIKTLYKLAPKNSGIDKIYFFNVANADQILGAKRVHPKSKLLEEEIVFLNNSDPSNLSVTKILKRPLRVAALWINADGDDTGSKFTTTVKSITVTSAP